MSKNGSELKIAVLNEQLRQVVEGLAAHRQDTKEFREEMRRDLNALREEVVSRADRHEQRDDESFKSIDERMALAEKETATREAAREAISRYKKWQWSLIAAAGATVIWNVLKLVEPAIHKILTGQ